MDTRSVMVATLTLALAAACKNSTGPSSTSYPGTYVGPITGSTTSGVLTVTIPSAASAAAVVARGSSAVDFSLESTEGTVTITGSLEIAGGSTYSLSGSFNTSTGQIVNPPGVTAGPYTLIGGFSGGLFNGTWTGPSGTTGSYSLGNASSGSKVLCGVYTGDASGVWNFGITGTALTGNVATDAGVVQIRGAVSGSSSPYTLMIGEPADPNISATGQLYSPPDSAKGSWIDNSNGHHGTWNGSAAGCH